MKGRRWFVALVMTAVAVGLGYVGYEVYRGPQVEQCYACHRPIHAHSRTLGLVSGRTRLFCCPACALSEHEQEGKPIRVTELTAFLTGAKLSPSDAFVVRGSDVNMCARTHELLDQDKRSADVHYDRCAPSMLVFGQRDEAVRFAREHGGEVLPLKEIVAEFSR